MVVGAGAGAGAPWGQGDGGGAIGAGTASGVVQPGGWSGRALVGAGT